MIRRRTPTPQEIGSAITYARRYAFTALTGVAPSGDDDDAQHAANTRPRKSAEKAAPADPLTALKQQVVAAGKACGWRMTADRMELAGLVAERRASVRVAYGMAGVA